MDNYKTSYVWDEELKNFINTTTDSYGTIFLGRNMVDEFVQYWYTVSKNKEDPNYELGKKLTSLPKIVFSRKLNESKWLNTTLAQGKLSEIVYKEKEKDDKDIIVYGGVNFVNSLIKEDLIDEYQLFVNPFIRGKGKTIFEISGELREL